MPVQNFIQALTQLPSLPGIFNPWRDVDPRYDIGPQAPEIRRTNLSRYLTERLETARYLLFAEAPSYQGCKFTGIAMTSERILLDEHEQVPADLVLLGSKQRTSAHRPTNKPHGFTEPTATIVWTRLTELGLGPRDFVHWNVMPCHPYTAGRQRLPELNNRVPTRQELDTYRHTVQLMLELFPNAQPIAVGDVSAGYLSVIGHKFPAVRHPSHGGASRFKSEMAGLAARFLER